MICLLASQKKTFHTGQMLLDKILLIANKGEKIIDVCEENGASPNALERGWGDND